MHSIIGIAPLTECRTRDRRVASSNPGRSSREIFFLSPALTFCAKSSLVFVPPPVLPQWQVKDPGHSAKSAGCMLHPKHAHFLVPTKSEWSDYVVRAMAFGTYQRNELTKNLSLNARPQSSQLAEPLWTDPGLKCAIGVRELISSLKKKKISGID